MAEDDGDPGVCAGALPPVVGGRLTGVDLTVEEAAARLERGERLELTDLQRRIVEAHALGGP